MTRSAQFERDLEQWLLAEAPASAPAGFHASVMDRARTLRQRPGWVTSLPVQRIGRGRGMTLLAAAALLGGAVAAGSGILQVPRVVLPVASASAVAIATRSPDASVPSPSESPTPSPSQIPVAGPGGVWMPTGSMVTRREAQAAVRLADGRVLVIGADLAAELYDPATGTWSPTGRMLKSGQRFPPVLLHDGRVLVDDSTYDPASGTWSATGPMVVDSGDGWGSATATVLGDGRVLVTKHRVAQLYDPASGTWTATGDLNVSRIFAAATLLPNGTVLVAGGAVADPQGFMGYRALDSAEVFDPVSGSWTKIASMLASGGVTASLLLDGKVLVAGTQADDPDGAGGRGVAHVYDPATGRWTTLPLRPGFTFDSAPMLPDGTILLTDTRNWYPPACVMADRYDPRTGSWTRVSGIPWCGIGSVTPLLDGTVLVAGGRDCGEPEPGECVANGEAGLYVPSGVARPPIPTFPTAPPPVSPTPIATAAP